MSESRRPLCLVLALPIILSGICALWGCADDVPPAVEAAPLGDTRDELGPYTVTALVLEHRGLAAVRLYHRDSESERGEMVEMEEILPGRFEAGIPGRPPGTRVHWFVEAEDIHGNFGHAPLLAEWGDRACADAIQSDAPAPEGGASYCFSVLR